MAHEEFPARKKNHSPDSIHQKVSSNWHHDRRKSPLPERESHSAKGPIFLPNFATVHTACPILKKKNPSPKSFPFLHMDTRDLGLSRISLSSPDSVPSTSGYSLQSPEGKGGVQA